MSLPTPFQTPEEYFVHINDILAPLNWSELFPKNQPIEVEIGAGDGSFIAQYANLRPEINFLAVERLLGRLRKVAKKSCRNNLQNLRCLRIEAAYLLSFLLPKNSVTALHIYFPDPWPKRKHRKNRLINEDFPELAARVLVPNGRIYLRTDDHDYFQQMQRVFLGSRYRDIDTPENLKNVVTDFEREFHRRGVPTNRLGKELTGVAT